LNEVLINLTLKKRKMSKAAEAVIGNDAVKNIIFDLFSKIYLIKQKKKDLFYTRTWRKRAYRAKLVIEMDRLKSEQNRRFKAYCEELDEVIVSLDKDVESLVTAGSSLARSKKAFTSLQVDWNKNLRPERLTKRTKVSSELMPALPETRLDFSDLHATANIPSEPPVIPPSGDLE
jgi:hypothetical protein